MAGSNTGVDPYLDELARAHRPKRVRTPAKAEASPSLFDVLYPPEEPMTNPNPIRGSLVVDDKSRVDEVMDAHATNARHWIDLGKPIAVAVAIAEGKVTAETFRAEADRHGKLPPLTEQRTLCWIPVMFAELCKEGQLQKRRRGDGSVVREYSKVQANHQVVYEPVPRT